MVVVEDTFPLHFVRIRLFINHVVLYDLDSKSFPSTKESSSRKPAP